MNGIREHVLDWAEERRLADVRQAPALAGVTPVGAAWVRIASRLTLWLGAVLLAASAVFFLAYNWDTLGRFGKFATNAYFFQEGHAHYYEQARYGEFWIAADGDLLLTALRGAMLERLGPR